MCEKIQISEIINRKNLKFSERIALCRHALDGMSRISKTRDCPIQGTEMVYKILDNAAKEFYKPTTIWSDSWRNEFLISLQCAMKYPRLRSPDHRPCSISRRPVTNKLGYK